MSLFIIKINTMRNMVVVGIMLLAYFCPDGAKFPPTQKDRKHNKS